MELDLDKIYEGSGDKGENPVEKTPMSVIKNIFSTDKVVNKPYDSPNSTSNVYVPDYEGYTKRGVHQNIRNIDIERGQNQSAWDKWGNFVPRVAGKIVTGVVEGISYIPEIFTPGSDYSNAGTEAASSANAWLDQHFPIYRKSEGVFGSATDLGWWLQNGEGLVTSVASFALEGIGFAKLFGAVGKAAKIGSTLEKGLGLLGDAKMASKAVRLGEQTLTAGMMAYTEGAMSGKRVYDEVYQSQFEKLQAQGMELTEAHDKAKKIAAESASTTVQLNTVINTGMNLLGGVSQFFNHEKNAVIDTARRAFAQQSGETTAQWMARLATETGNKYARELTGYIEGQGTKQLVQKGLKRGREATAEGIEELTNQFAERTGIEEGKEGKVYNILNQFGQLSKYFDRTMDEEGALNFMMGAIAGPAQQALTHNIPIHKVDTGVRTNNGEMVNAKGEVVTDEKEAAREYAKGSFGMNRVTAFESRQIQGIKFFDNIRSKIEADVQNISNIETEMKEAARRGDFIKAEELRDDYFHLMNKNSVALGFSEGLKETYRSLRYVDNITSDKDRKIEEAQEIERAIETAKSTREDTTELEKSLDEKKTEIEKASDKTQAQLLGFTDSKENNDYKEKAEKAIETLTELQKIHDKVQQKYGSEDTTNLEQAHVADFIFDRSANLYLMKERRKELQKQLNEFDVEPVDAEYTTQVREEKRYNRDYTRLLNQFEQIDSAIGVLSEHQKNPSLSGERLLSKYGALNPTSESQATADVLEKLTKDRESKKTQLEQLETTLLDTDGYKAFVEKGGKSYKDYVDYLIKNYSESKKQTAYSAAINELDLQIESHQHFLSELEKAPTLNKIQKNTANFFQELNKKRNEQELKKIQNKIEKLNNDKRIAELRVKRLKELRDKYEAEFNELNRIIDEKKAELEKVIHDLKYFRARPKSETTEETIKRKTDWTLKKENLIFEIEEIYGKRQALLQTVMNIDEKLNEANTGIATDEDQFVDEDEVNESQQTDDTEVVEPDTSELEVEESTAPEPSGPSPITQTYYNLLDSLSDDGKIAVEDQREKIVTGQESFSLNLLQIEEQLGLVPSDMRLPILVAMKDFIMEQQGEIATAAEIVDAINQDETQLPSEPEVVIEETEVFDTELDNDGQEIEEVPVELLMSDTKEFTGNKQINPASSIANRDLKFAFGTNSKGDYVKNGVPELEEKKNYELVNPDGAQPGTELVFEVDVEYQGTVIDYDGNLEGTDPQSPESIENYLDENRKIITSEDYIGNVPIKISKKDGTVIGYIHRNKWIGATRDDVSGPERFANTVDIVDGKPGNVDKEIQLNIQQREQIVAAFNRGQTKSYGKITSKKSGSLVSLPGYDTASKHLKGVELGIINKGQILGVNTTASVKGEISITSDEGNRVVSTHNMVVAIIPRADGTFTPTILKSQRLMDEKSDAFDAISRLTELLLAPGTDKNKKEIELIKNHTGFDVSTVNGYREYIMQYYTHFTTLKSALNSSKVKSILDTVSGIPTILLKTQLGISEPIKATLNNRGEVSQEFKAALKDLLSNRYKTVSLTTDKVKGVNSQSNFNYMEYHKGEWKLNPKHQGKDIVTYNEYILPYLQTNLTFAKGPNKDGSTPTISAGGRKVNRFIYDVNPIVKFELDKAPVENKPVPVDMTLPDTTLYEGDNLLEDLGIIDMSPSLSLGTMDKQPISLGYLEDMFNSTPIESRNSITPLDYYGKSKKLGQKYLPEGYNPFKECN